MTLSMKEFDLENDIKDEFFLDESNILTDEFIRKNPDIFMDKGQN